METEWIVAGIMAYILIGMLLTEILLVDSYNRWFLIILFWYPVAIFLALSSIFIGFVVAIYRLTERIEYWLVK